MHAGPPSTPAHLAATENGVGSLNISWSLVTIEGVAVTFAVIVTNLNDSSTGPMEVSGIQDQHYIFTLEDSTSCDVYMQLPSDSIEWCRDRHPQCDHHQEPPLTPRYIPCTGLPSTFSSQDSKRSHTECLLQCEDMIIACLL